MTALAYHLVTTAVRFCASTVVACRWLQDFIMHMPLQPSGYTTAVLPQTFTGRALVHQGCDV